jgi:O-antigen/teichoic acid export membrane protein
MKVGQTSIVVFLSKLLGSALGFLGTLYFARELGAEVIGVYTLVLTVVGWLILASEVGVGTAMVKRISEGTDRGAHLTAALLTILAFALSLSVLVVLGTPVLESYVSEFDQHVTLSVVWFVIALIFIQLFDKFVFKTLKGERKVHIVGLLNPVQIGGQSLLQIALVFAGYGLFGMLVGYIVGGIIVGAVGLVWVSVRPKRPRKRHFKSLFEYAKFSWLGGLRNRAFNEVDILLLGVFVQTGLVGVYSVAWSIAKFLDLFGTSVASTVFPEISHTSAQQSRQDAAAMLEDALAYTGLIAIPGLVGGVLLGDRLLMLYGEEFVDGTAVLGLLILSVLIYSYQKQLRNGLNGLDRPDLAFRINAVFIVLNVGLNLALIWQYGIEGAAVATATSVAVVLLLSHYMLSQLITFEVPYTTIAQQWIAALVMGATVFGARTAIERLAVIDHNAAIVVALVALGACIYFVTLFGISTDFQETVNRNLPVELPTVR